MKFGINLLCLLLVGSILLPTAKKFVHAFYEHTELLCGGEGTLHFHEVEIDCDFQKFYPLPNFVHDATFETLHEHSFDSNDIDFLDRLTTSSKTYFSLRAPPFTS